MNSLVIAAPHTLKLVKDAVVLVKVAELPPEVVVNGDRLDRARIHVDVPNLERQVVTREDIAPVVGELDVRDGRDNLGKEGPVCRILFLLEAWMGEMSYAVKLRRRTETYTWRAARRGPSRACPRA